MYLRSRSIDLRNLWPGLDCGLFPRRMPGGPCWIATNKGGVFCEVSIDRDSTYPTCKGLKHETLSGWKVETMKSVAKQLIPSRTVTLLDDGHTLHQFTGSRYYEYEFPEDIRLALVQLYCLHHFPWDRYGCLVYSIDLRCPGSQI